VLLTNAFFYLTGGQVLPALEDAEKALAALNKNDIIEIKTFTKPPALVLVRASRLACVFCFFLCLCVLVCTSTLPGKCLRFVVLAKSAHPLR